MKYILIELDNDTPDELMEGLATAIRENLVDVDVPAIVRFGGLYTSL